MKQATIFKVVPPFLWLFIPLLIYIYHLFPSIYGGDSPELITSGVILGIPHAPGYPVYCLFAKLFSNIIVFGNKAYRINTFSAVISCVNIGLLFVLIRNTIKNTYIAFLVAVIFAFLPIQFEQSLVSEVFGLNLLFFLLILFILTKDFSNKHKELYLPKYYLASLLFGLGLGNHHILVFSLVGFAILILSDVGRERFFKLLSKPILYLFCCLGLSVYLYLLLRAQSNPAVNFGDPDTIQRLWAVFTRKEFGSFELHPTALQIRTADTLIGQTLGYVVTLLRGFGLVGLLLIFIGFIVGAGNRLFLPLIGIFLLASPLFVLYSNLAPNTLSLWRQERFYLFPEAILCLFLAFSLLGVDRLISKIINTEYLKKVILLTITLIIIFSGDRIHGSRDNFYFHDFSKNIVKGAEKNGTLFLDEILFDEYGSGLAYLTNVLYLRRDLIIIAKSGAMFENIYGEDFFDLSFPEKEKRKRNIENNLFKADNLKLCIAVMDKNRISTQKELISNGLIYKTYSKGITPWFAYSRREIISKRALNNDYPTKLVLVHYPYFQGKFSLDMKDALMAEKYFNECLMYGYDLEWLQFNIGSVYSQFGDLKRAEYFYSNAFRLDPYFPNTYFGLGYIYLTRNEYPTAERYFLKCLELNPNFSKAYYNLGLIKYNSGRISEAKYYFNKYFQFEPESPLKKSIEDLGLVRN
ncbi:MAG: DUF2723 domain-containing protein [bacterium]